MNKYRDRLRIVADILFIAGKGAKKTQIMYQANLSYKLLCRYLVEVLDAGLVSIQDEDYYMLTAKGKQFLVRHDEYSKRCKSLEEHFNHVNNEKVFLEKMCFNPNKDGSNLSRIGKRREAKKVAM